jgi:hypothetical protein
VRWYDRSAGSRVGLGGEEVWEWKSDVDVADVAVDMEICPECHLSAGWMVRSQRATVLACLRIWVCRFQQIWRTVWFHEKLA